MKLFYMIAVCLLVLMTSFGIKADNDDSVLDEFGITVKEKKKVAGERKNFDEYIKKARETCGFELKYTVDYRSFKEYLEKEKPPGRGYRDVLFYCRTMIDTIHRVCRDKDYRAAFKKKVEEVVCQYDPDAHGAALKREGPSAAIKKKKLVLGYLMRTGNIRKELTRWLHTNL